MKRIFCAILVAIIFIGTFPGITLRANAEETLSSTEKVEALDISAYSLIESHSGFRYAAAVFFTSATWGQELYGDAHMTLRYDEGIGSLYLQFGARHGLYSVVNEDTGEEITCGEKGYLNEFVDLVALFGSAPSRVTLRFPDGGPFHRLRVFTPGEVPSYVQKWNDPAEGETDLILFSTHGDDEQLFFAGLLPYYAGELRYEVLVVYMTDHHNYSASSRMVEMLDGLWAVGVTTYPIFGEFIDYKADFKETYYTMLATEGNTHEDVVSFVTEQIRRFHPLVVVAHDFDGEYGHAQHRIYADCVAEALEITSDPEQYSESAQKYGTWDVPKAYFHLYEETPIVMDWDQPLASFDGLTAFQVTQQLGFPCHVSQQFTWFRNWLCDSGNITKATQIEDYSPCKYGLYRSTVGDDVQKDDFFENLNTHAQQALLDEQGRIEEDAQKRETEPASEESTTAETAQTPTETASVIPEPQNEAKALDISHWVGCILVGALLIVGVISALIHLKNRKEKT